MKQLTIRPGENVIEKKIIWIFIWVFLSSLFYANSSEFKLFRAASFSFLILGVLAMVKFQAAYYIASIKYTLPKHMRLYTALLLLFIFYNILVDFLNPDFSLFTLLFNPYALLAVVPIFAFYLGMCVENLSFFLKFLWCVSILFVIFFFIDIPVFHNYHGYVCADVIIPLFILATFHKKKKLYASLMMLMACIFSLVISDYRIIFLRVILFLFLFFSLSAVRKFSLLKVTVILVSAFAVFQLVTNLSSILQFVASLTGRSNMGVNTRTFLYEELFNDFKSSELFLGRGFLGTYYSDFFERIQMEGLVDFEQEHRFTNEVGFLNLILKGGYGLYFLYIYPLVYSSLKSIFHSKNPLIFKIGVYIFAELLLMFFENIPHFGLNFFIYFFLAGYAFKSMLYETHQIEQLPLIGFGNLRRPNSKHSLS
jgi:hypothetical protein